MLNQERKDKILQIIQERGAVSVSELTGILDASESTVRRDLIELSKKGNINKVHGGATLNKQQFISQEENVSAKKPSIRMKSAKLQSIVLRKFKVMISFIWMQAQPHFI